MSPPSNRPLSSFRVFVCALKRLLSLRPPLETPKPHGQAQVNREREGDEFEVDLAAGHELDEETDE